MTFEYYSVNWWTWFDMSTCISVFTKNMQGKSPVKLLWTIVENDGMLFLTDSCCFLRWHFLPLRHWRGFWNKRNSSFKTQYSVQSSFPIMTSNRGILYHICKHHFAWTLNDTHVVNEGRKNQYNKWYEIQIHVCDIIVRLVIIQYSIAHFMNINVNINITCLVFSSTVFCGTDQSIIFTVTLIGLVYKIERAACKIGRALNKMMPN